MVALIAVGAVALILLAGAVEYGYATRVWARASRIGRGPRYVDEAPPDSESEDSSEWGE